MKYLSLNYQYLQISAERFNVNRFTDNDYIFNQQVIFRYIFSSKQAILFSYSTTNFQYVSMVGFSPFVNPEVKNKYLFRSELDMAENKLNLLKIVGKN